MTASVWELFAPSTVLPLTCRVLATARALLTVTGALAVMNAELEKVAAALKAAAAFAIRGPLAVTAADRANVVGALIIKLLLALVPRVMLPVAVKGLPAATVTGAFAMTGAAKLLAALTVKVLLDPVPMTAFP